MADGERIPEDQLRLLQHLRVRIANKLVDIETMVWASGLPMLTGLTLVIRKPGDPGYSLVITNEKHEESKNIADEVVRRMAVPPENWPKNPPA